jgi:chromosome segregation ATPase
MGMPGHSDRIDRIEREIREFQERATELLRRERAAQARVQQLKADERDGRMRSALHARALRRAQERAWALSGQREAFVEQGLRAIVLTLDEQARRTRDRLDRELERLLPVQEDWERLRSAFDALEAAVATPAVEELAGQWRGKLEIPEFPVPEREGYLKPFPHGALLF